MPFPLTPFDSSLSIASPNAPPRTDHQAMPFPHNGPTSEPNKYKSTRTNPTTDRICLGTPFDSSVLRPPQTHLRRQNIFRDFPNVPLHFSMVLLDFPWFYSILPWFYSWFIRFFHGFVLPNFLRFYSTFTWFLLHGFTRLLHNFTLQFQSPQMHLGERTRGESIPHRHPIATWYIPLARSTPRPP